MAKYNFTRNQFNEIKALLEKRLGESRNEQKVTRAKIRKLGFKISDHHNGFTGKDFESLLNCGIMNIVDEPLTKSCEKEIIEVFQKHTKPSNNWKKSLPPIVDEDTKIVVLGTMPSENSLENQKYYNNSKNQFWKIIFSIFNNGNIINDYSKKIDLLKQNQIGLWDVLETCEREGSLDTNIKNFIANDFEAFFKKYPNISTIIFNGKDSSAYFRQSINANINGKLLIQLNSTSSLNSHKTIGQKIDEWERYLKARNIVVIKK